MAYKSRPIASKLNELVVDLCLHYDLASFADMNPSEQVLAGTWELASEVQNGGFMQYFHNSSRQRAEPMIAVLRSIDAPGAADILESAMALAGPGTPWGDEPNFLVAIKLIPADTRRQLSELERKLYDDLDNVHLLVFRYLSKHRDQIDAPEEFWKEATLQ